MLYLPAPTPHIVPARLERCDGAREVEGVEAPCLPECLAHYDGNNPTPELDLGDRCWALYPNHALAAPHLLAKTTLVDATWWREDWDGDHDTGLYYSEAFQDEHGDTKPCWLLCSTVHGDPEGHLVCVLDHPAAARAEMQRAVDVMMQANADRCLPTNGPAWCCTRAR